MVSNLRRKRLIISDVSRNVVISRRNSIVLTWITWLSRLSWSGRLTRVFWVIRCYRMIWIYRVIRIIWMIWIYWLIRTLSFYINRYCTIADYNLGWETLPFCQFVTRWYLKTYRLRLIEFTLVKLTNNYFTSCLVNEPNSFGGVTEFGL